MTDRITSASLTELELARQHIEWLRIYVLGMKAENWRDMRDHAERQLNELSEIIYRLDAAESLTGEGDFGGPLRCAPLEITEKMVTQALLAYWDLDTTGTSGNMAAMRAAIGAALQASELASGSPKSIHEELRGLEPGGKNHSTVRDCPKVENASGVPSGTTGGANGDGCLGTVKDRPATKPLSALQASEARGSSTHSPSEEELREVAKQVFAAGGRSFGALLDRDDLTLKAMRTILQTTRTETELEAAGEGK